MADLDSLSLLCRDSTGLFLATASDDRTVCVQVLESKARKGLRLVGHEKGVLFARFTPDSSAIVTCSEDFTASMW